MDMAQLQWVIINKSDEIVACAGDFGAKSSSIINYTIRIFPFQGIIKNIKKLQYKNFVQLWKHFDVEDGQLVYTL